MVKNLPAVQETSRFDHWVGKIPGERNGNLLQYSCLGKPMGRGAGRLQSMGSQRFGNDLATDTSPPSGDNSKSLLTTSSRSDVMCLVAQPCPTLCEPMDCSLPSSSVHEDSSGKNNWSGLPCSPPGDLPNPGIEQRSPTLQVNSLPSEPLTTYSESTVLPYHIGARYDSSPLC